MVQAMETGAKPQGKIAEANGLRLNYLDWGNSSAPDMLLVHGMTGNSRAWDFFANALREEYHILALDQRGHGDSEWPADHSYTTRSLVSDIDAFVDALKLEKFVYIGHSMGAHNGLGYASRRPQKVGKLVLVDHGPARENPSNFGPSPQSFASIDDLVDWYQQTNKIQSREVLRHRALWSAKLGANGMYEFKHDPEIRAGWVCEDLWGIMPKVTCPTLLLRGGESTSMSREYAERTVKALAEGQLQEIPGAGHSIMLDQPARFEEAVRKFLAQ
ncbi:MAG: alpha/beta hydrolase [Dehalococcoidia bacterium]|nr:alpha/beta hydrolase [Dehalococcoidia bacterium]